MRKIMYHMKKNMTPMQKNTTKNTPLTHQRKNLKDILMQTRQKVILNMLKNQNLLQKDMEKVLKKRNSMSIKSYTVVTHMDPDMEKDTTKDNSKNMEEETLENPL